jgi:hypothetical protein
MAIGSSMPDAAITTNSVCYGFNLTRGGPLSRLPLSINVYTFTFFYLVYIIGKYGLAESNVPILVIFPLVILYHAWWTVWQTCSPLSYVLLSGGIGAVLGALFSYAIDSSGIVELQYFNGIKHQDVCSRPSKQQFKCTSRKSV